MKKKSTVYLLVTLVVAGWITVSAGLGNRSKEYKANGLHVTYNLLNGRFQGKYTSFWPNGEKKAEGQMKQNMRIGLWNLYDSTGQLIMQREYRNGYEFKRRWPHYAEGPYARMDSVSLQRISNQKFWSYGKIEEASVIVAKRIWRDIEPLNNTALFDRHVLDTLIGLCYKDTTIVPYTNDEFSNVYTNDKFQERLKQWNGSIVRWKIKEDWYYDVETMSARNVIIGICPVVAIGGGKESMDLCWFYFPNIRKVLFALNVDQAKDPSHRKNVEEIFFFRSFSSTIIKESNVNNKTLAEIHTGEALKNAQLETELRLFETEHDLWLEYQKFPQPARGRKKQK